MSLVFASYNIHRCYGRDGQYRPARIRQVIQQLDAQVIALQEVEQLSDAPGFLDYLCEHGPWQVIHGPTLSRDSGQYGNALLTALPIRAVEKIDLSLPGREPRGAILAQLQHQQRHINVLVTHLGLCARERRQQVRSLLASLQKTGAQDSVNNLEILMGDFNEWWPWSTNIRLLNTYMQKSPAIPTYPAGFPLFALDRIWLSHRDRMLSITAVDNRLTRQASDHLPLLARIK